MTFPYAVSFSSLASFPSTPVQFTRANSPHVLSSHLPCLRFTYRYMHTLLLGMNEEVHYTWYRFGILEVINFLPIKWPFIALCIYTIVKNFFFFFFKEAWHAFSLPVGILLSRYSNNVFLTQPFLYEKSLYKGHSIHIWAVCEFLVTQHYIRKALRE